MEVSGQIHIPAALTAVKALSLPIELEAVWTPESEMEEDRMPKKIFNQELEGSRRSRRPRK
jgi:hypothetical protein